MALLGIERAIRVVSTLAAGIFFGAVLAVLSAALAMPPLRAGRIAHLPVGCPGRGSRWDRRGGRSTLEAVSFASSYGACARGARRSAALSRRSRREAELAAVRTGASLQPIERTPPIVLVIFDELPLNSLLTAEETHRCRPVPEFRRARARVVLVSRRQYRGVQHRPRRACHSVGTIPDGGDNVPTLQYYPVNLFTTWHLTTTYPHPSDSRSSVRPERVTPRKIPRTRSSRSCRTSVSCGCTSCCLHTDGRTAACDR